MSWSTRLPAQSQLRTPATSMRVYLNVGRPRQTPGAETTCFPKGMYSYTCPSANSSRTSRCLAIGVPFLFQGLYLILLPLRAQSHPKGQVSIKPSYVPVSDDAP